MNSIPAIRKGPDGKSFRADHSIAPNNAIKQDLAKGVDVQFQKAIVVILVEMVKTGIKSPDRPPADQKLKCYKNEDRNPNSFAHLFLDQIKDLVKLL